MVDFDITVSTVEKSIDWDEFLCSCPKGEYQQSSSWAQFKRMDGWQTCRVIARKAGAIAGGFQLLWKKRKGCKVGYVSRGPVVDENALIEALQSKKIGGACLDVFETEPVLADSLLRTLDNVILSPHTAGMPDGLKFHKKRYEYFVENIKRVAAKKAPLNALNRIESTLPEDPVG